MRKSIRNIMLASGSALMFYLPGAQATDFYFGHHANQAPRAATQFYYGQRGHFNSDRGWRSQRPSFHGKRFGHFRGRGHHRGHHFGHRGFNRGNFHGFDGNGYYQKRRHVFRDKHGRLRYYYR